MKKPRGDKMGSKSVSRSRALRLLKRLVEADAVDLAYIARIEQRIPEVTDRHPMENTSVGVKFVHRREAGSDSSTPADRITALHDVLASAGIRAASTGAQPMKPAIRGTVRMFRAETDRQNRRSDYEGWNRRSAARGSYFTTSPIVAARYGEPAEAPRGATLRYVDVPKAVADASLISRPEILGELRGRSQRLPVAGGPDDLDDVEYYLDSEWSGRAMPVPAIVEADNAVSSNNVFDTTEWWFGHEQLLTDAASKMPAHVTIQYIAGPAVDHDGGSIPAAWTGATRSTHRFYANANVMIPVDGDSVLFIRTGVEAHSVELLLKILTGNDLANSDKINFGAVESALFGVQHLITGDSAAMLQGKLVRARRLDSLDVTIPRSAVADLARVVAHSDAAPSNSSSIGWNDEASVMRKFLSARCPVPLRSSQLGCLNVSVIDDATFATLSCDIVSAPLSNIGDDGVSERLALQMERSAPALRKARIGRARHNKDLGKAS